MQPDQQCHGLGIYEGYRKIMSRHDDNPATQWLGKSAIAMVEGLPSVRNSLAQKRYSTPIASWHAFWYPGTLSEGVLKISAQKRHSTPVASWHAFLIPGYPTRGYT